MHHCCRGAATPPDSLNGKLMWSASSRDVALLRGEFGVPAADATEMARIYNENIN